MDHEIWEAESVVIDDKTAIAFKPQFLNKEKVSLKEYVEAKEAHMNKTFLKPKTCFQKPDQRLK